jgi:hypothetical protein
MFKNFYCLQPLLTFVGTLVGKKEKTTYKDYCKWLIFSDPRGVTNT